MVPLCSVYQTPPCASCACAGGQLVGDAALASIAVSSTSKEVSTRNPIWNRRGISHRPLLLRRLELSWHILGEIDFGTLVASSWLSRLLTDKQISHNPLVLGTNSPIITHQPGRTTGIPGSRTLQSFLCQLLNCVKNYLGSL